MVLATGHVLLGRLPVMLDTCNVPVYFWRQACRASGCSCSHCRAALLRSSRKSCFWLLLLLLLLLLDAGSMPTSALPCWRNQEAIEVTP